MATALTIPFSVGDTVYVAYPFPSQNSTLPVTAVVSRINVNGAGDSAVISFTNQADVVYTDADKTVFTTQAAAAKDIVDSFITRLTPAVLLDTTTSGVSTAGLTATTLVRFGTA